MDKRKVACRIDTSIVILHVTESLNQVNEVIGRKSDSFLNESYYMNKRRKINPTIHNRKCSQRSGD